MKIHPFLLLIFCFIVITATAQQDSIQARGVKEGTIALGFEMGASSIQQNAIAEKNGGDNGYVISASPVYSTLFDWSYSQGGSFGVLISYLAFNDYPPTPAYPANSYTNPETMVNNNVVRGVIRNLWHLSRKKNFDFFVGIQAGVLCVFEYFYQGPLNPNLPPIGNNFSPYHAIEYNGDLQLIMGFKGYLSDEMGIQAELGYGAPLEVACGITYRIEPHK